MSQYDFDRVIDRTGTGSLKYDFGLSRTGRTDLLPMWVADMDFALPEEILAPVIERTKHGIFGYTDAESTYYDAMESWFKRRYRWDIDRSWNTVVPGVVYGISLAVRTLTKPGDTILIQEPVYYPFRNVIETNHRVCAALSLRETGGRYTFDPEEFARIIRERNVKAFILCSPHNPVGRVWTKEELETMSRICLEKGVSVIADEIHCDFIYPGNTFVPYASLGEEAASHAVICTSPSKTFNMAGLQVANILIPDPAIRKAYRAENEANGFSLGNVLGLELAKSVFLNGEPWLEELLIYLKGNLDYMRTFLANRIPDVRLIEPEGTYLIWTDFSKLFSDWKELHRFIQDEAKLWLDDGIIFGKEAGTFERFNIACPRRILRQALLQLEAALH